MGILTAANIQASVPAGDSLVLDTSAVIAYLTGNEPASAAARLVVTGLVTSGRNPAVLSAVSAAELLVRPLSEGPQQAARMRTFLLGFSGLSIRSADLLVAAEAARIRAATRATMLDALIAATATLTSSPWLITNDRDLRDRLDGFDWSTRVMFLGEVAP